MIKFLKTYEAKLEYTNSIVLERFEADETVDASIVNLISTGEGDFVDIEFFDGAIAHDVPVSVVEEL